MKTTLNRLIKQLDELLVGEPPEGIDNFGAIHLHATFLGSTALQVLAPNSLDSHMGAVIINAQPDRIATTQTRIGGAPGGFHVEATLFSIVLALATVLGPPARPSRDEVVDGSTGPGSVYRLVRPADWNGILLLYAHGYVSKDAPVAITPDAQLVISLASSHGFAVAVSSFSENGWV